jgi:predicted secreted protein
MSVKLGLDAILYRGAEGSTASEEVENVKDLTLSLEKGEADVTTRKSKGWRLTIGTLKDASVEFSILNDPEDPDYQAFASAFMDDTPIALFISDGNGSGLDADFSITNFSIDQNLEEAQSINVTAKPTASKRPPLFTFGGGGE